MFRRNKKYHEAVDVLLELAKNESMKPVAYSSISDIYHTSKNFAEALDYSNKLLDIDPNDKAAIAAKAHLIHDHLKEHESEYEFFKKASNIIPENEDVMAGLAEALYIKGMSSESEFQIVAKKITSGKYSTKLKAKTFMNLGNVGLTKKDFHSAIQNYHSCQIMTETRYAKTCKNSIRHVCNITPKSSSAKRLCPRS